MLSIGGWILASYALVSPSTAADDAWAANNAGEEAITIGARFKIDPVTGQLAPSPGT